MKHQFIEANSQRYGVEALCQALEVSRSGYYAARNRAPSARGQRQAQLTSHIRDIHRASRATYGAPRVHADLCEQGIGCSRNTVAKLMRRAAIVPKTIRRFRVTTDSRKTKAAANLVGRAFSAQAPNRCWLSDITFIPTREGWLYLASILDLYSRAIVGWSMSKTLDSQLAMSALTMAVHQRRSTAKILHSDQGSTYAAANYRRLMCQYGIQQSMSRKGDCWDNAPMESFFHTLKTELVMHCDYKTREEARASIFEYIEVFYNRQRRHSTVQYKAPLAFETMSNP